MCKLVHDQLDSFQEISNLLKLQVLEDLTKISFYIF